MKKKENFEKEYILPVNSCITYIKQTSLRTLQELPNSYNKSKKIDIEKSLSNVFKNIHEQIGNIHNCVRNLNEELDNIKPTLLTKTNKHIKKTLSDRWNNYRTDTSSLPDYILIIKEEISEYNDKLLKTIEENDQKKFKIIEAKLRKDITVFFYGLSKILTYIKYRY